MNTNIFSKRIVILKALQDKLIKEKSAVVNQARFKFLELRVEQSYDSALQQMDKLIMSLEQIAGDIGSMVNDKAKEEKENRPKNKTTTKRLPVPTGQHNRLRKKTGVSR